MKWLVPVMILGGLLACSDQRPVTPEAQENRALVERWVKELNETKSANVIDDFLSPDYVWHLPGEDVRGVEEVKRRFDQIFSTYPDFHLQADDVIATSEKVVVRWTEGGTNSSTGRQETWASISIDRVGNGRFIEGWEIGAEEGWVSPQQ